MVDDETPKALMFDVFGTVVDWRSSLIRHLSAFDGLDLKDIDIAHFVDRWRGLYQPSMEEVRTGRRGWEILDVLHQESLCTLMDAHGLDRSDPGIVAALTRLWHRLDPWPDSVPGLTALKRRFILSTLSNGNTALLVNMAKYAGLPWDVVLGAETAGAYKPLPEAYLNNIRLLGLTPPDCMMVAAHNDDLAAAQAVGMQTAFLARPREHGPGQTGDLVPTGDWTVAVDDMEALARHLLDKAHG